MELSKEEILEFFENIDSNQFMLRKIVDFSLLLLYVTEQLCSMF